MGGRMQDWLNRIGLTLQFIAVFLVTPEIIGRERVGKFVDDSLGLSVRWLGRFTSWSIGFSGDKLIRYILMPAGFAIGYLVARHLGISDATVLGGIAFIAIIFGAGAIFYYLSYTIIAVIIVSVSRIMKAWLKSGRSFLSLGATLFIVGFICLMWATFVHAN
jgi:hypothetical protein